MSSQVVAVDTLEHEPARSNRRLLVAGMVIFFALGLLAYVYASTQSNAAYYLEVGQLSRKGSSAYGEQVRTMGKVLPGSIVRGRDGSVRFTAYDANGQVPVVYNKTVPDVFGDDVEVVVEGAVSPGGQFQAHTLLAKCPSKFESKQAASLDTRSP